MMDKINRYDLNVPHDLDVDWNESDSGEAIDANELINWLMTMQEDPKTTTQERIAYGKVLEAIGEKCV